MPDQQRQAWTGGPVDSVVFAVLMVAAAFLGRENPHFVYPEVLLGFLALLGFNLVNFSVLPRFLGGHRRAALSVAYDILFLSFIVKHSGGPESYFWVLYLLPVFNAALALGRRGILAATGSVVGLLALFHGEIWLEPRWAELLGLLIKGSVICASALVVGRVAAGERDSRLRLEEERRRAEREQAQAREQLLGRDRLAILGTLSASVAHELSSPLAAILGYTEVALAQNSPPAQIERILFRIQDCAGRCRKIMRDMLSFSRQKAGERRLCDVNALLRECVELKSCDGLTDEVSFELDLAGDLPPARLISGEFQQVVFNLLTNAQQAIRGSGRGSGRIRLVSRNADGDVHVSVEDDGPGVPPEAAQRIWEPFFTTKPEGAGTGLGLAICRQIVTSYGGSLTLETVPCGGAAFHIRLPLGAVVSPPACADADRREAVHA